ncbi:acyl carrier protein [Ottowia sp.]|uniref:acyl carrier protein n=1 Tax=Ottowia sp. TaxID=1898956 RepID=UPI002C3D0C01|nr:acyl carrier protein [Ottowia sp.]HOB66202.1 acyl carrier protein [Ottowia sp.]HPZ58239.1 acyl carrier protein [Ottowia sp.]HQD48597.1 acyl carrier protein [Ottowia sp.]
MTIAVADALLKLAQRFFKIDPSAIYPDTPLNAVGDSLDMVDFLSDVEAEFGIHISDADLVDARTVHDLAAVVERLSAQKHAKPAA